MPNLLARPAAAWFRLPMLVRFLICHAALGFVIAAVAVAAFVLADPNGAGGILLHAAGHWWPVVALWFFLGLTFGAVQIGAATMLLADRPDPPRPRGNAPVTPMVLAPALARARRRR